METIQLQNYPLKVKTDDDVVKMPNNTIGGKIFIHTVFLNAWLSLEEKLCIIHTKMLWGQLFFKIATLNTN